MAKFTPGPAVAEIRGSVGGTVFSRNRYSAYTRVRTVPVVSTTSFAITAKSRMTAATQAWQSLTQAQRNAWLSFSLSNPKSNSLGQQVALTGHAAYVGLYVRALVGGATPLTEPPVTTAPLGLTAISLECDIGLGDVQFTFAATPLGATEKMYLQAAIVSSAGIRYVRNLYRLIFLSDPAAPSPLNFETELAARLGAPTVGQTLHIKASVFDNVTMLLGPPAIASAVCVET